MKNLPETDELIIQLCIKELSLKLFYFLKFDIKRWPLASWEAIEIQEMNNLF